MIQAVILAAGNSTRMHPLTITRPKPMLPILNRPILEYVLDSIIETERVDEAIIVTGYKREIIKQHFGNKYKTLDLKYSYQEKQLGTWDAVYNLKEMIEDRFIVLYGDNIHSSHDIKRCTYFSNSILLKQTETPEQFGIVTLDGYLVKDIVEKPKLFVGDTASTGVIMLDRNAFKHLPQASDTGEFYLTDLIRKICGGYPVYGVMANGDWLQHSYPWDLLNSSELLISKIKDSNIEGLIEKYADIKGDVHIGNGTVIKNFTQIEGPVIIGKNCIIGPGAYIRSGTVIGDNCHIGVDVEIKNSIIMNNTKIKHRTGILDSIIGEYVNVGAGTEVANLRHDGHFIESIVNGNLVSTNRKKFGVVMGDGAKLGIHTSIYPGRKIWPGMKLNPNEIVKKDYKP